MELARKAALFFTLILVFAMPTDGMVDLGGSLVKVAGLMVAGLTLLLMVTGAEIRGAAWFLVMCLLYVSWTLLSFLWTWMPVDYFSPNAINSQQSIKADLYLLVLMILMFQVLRTERDVRLVFTAFILGTLGVIYFLVKNFDPGAATVRYEIVGFDSNETAVQIGMTLPMAIYIFQEGRSWLMRLLVLAYLPVAMFAIMLTGSRTGLVIMLLGLAGFIPLVWRSVFVVKLGSVALLVALLVGVGSQIPEKTLDRLFTTGSELTKGTLNARSITWARAYEEWRQEPVIGQGLGSFRRIINKYNISYTAHNSFVAISVEQGVIGLLLYVGVILTSLLHALRLPVEQRMIMLSLVLIVTFGQMSLTLHEDMPVWLAYLLPVLMYQLLEVQRPHRHLAPGGGFGQYAA